MKNFKFNENTFVSFFEKILNRKYILNFYFNGSKFGVGLWITDNPQKIITACIYIDESQNFFEKIKNKRFYAKREKWNNEVITNCTLIDIEFVNKGFYLIKFKFENIVLEEKIVEPQNFILKFFKKWKKQN